MARIPTIALMVRSDSGSSNAEPFTTMTQHDMGAGKSDSHPLELIVLGLCSGASLSSVGCSLVCYRRENPHEPLHMELIRYEEIAIPLPIRSPILTLLRDYRSNPHAMLRVHNMLGHMFATTVQCFCNVLDIPMHSIDLMGTQADSIPASVLPSTYLRTETNLQFKSWTAVIAAETSITTAANLHWMRRASHPSEPSTEASIDSLFLHHPTKCRVCLTISDLITFSLLPPYESPTVPNSIPYTSSARVCGPGTLLIDYSMRYISSNQVEHDYDGSYGARGTINHSIVDRFFATHDYSAQTPSLNIAFEMFGQHEAQSLIDDCLFLGMSDVDTVATMTRITAQNIVLQYHNLLSEFSPDQEIKVDEFFICGKGSNNMNIVEFIENTLPNVITKPLDDIGIPSDAKDSVSCAQLGLERVMKHALVVDQNVEAEQAELMGNTVRGKKWPEIHDSIVRFSGGKEVPLVKSIVIDRKENNSRVR